MSRLSDIERAAKKTVSFDPEEYHRKQATELLELCATFRQMGEALDVFWDCNPEKAQEDYDDALAAFKKWSE